MISLVESGGGASLYQLKITLMYSSPPIWRRIIVPARLKLNRLHDVIQRIMPWTNSHLHQFAVAGTYYGISNPEFADDWMKKTLDERRHTLADIAPKLRSTFIYEYDFGDGWEHKVVVEKILPPDPGFKRVICLAGKNAGPPDDCGGIPGYYRMLEILANPKDEEHEHMKEWIGGEWDPKWFDLDGVNAGLKSIKI